MKGSTEALAACHDAHHSLYAHALGPLLQATGADVVAFHRIMVDGTRQTLRTGFLATIGAEDHVARLRHGYAKLVEYPAMQIDELPSSTAFTFWAADTAPEAFVDNVWHGSGLAQMATTLVTDGGVCLGQLSAYKFDAEGPWTTRTLRQLGSHRPKWLKSVQQAHQVGGPATPEWLVLVCDQNGCATLMSTAPDDLATARLRRALEMHLQRFRGMQQDRIEVYLDEARVDLQRVWGNSGPSYVATARRHRPWQLPVAHTLTPTQRSVCRYLAAGATIAEVARCMERSVDTIRAHLKQIYNHLGISSRAELTAHARVGAVPVRVDANTQARSATASAYGTV